MHKRGWKRPDVAARIGPLHPLFGTHLSMETKEKLRIANLGKKRPWTSEMNKKRVGILHPCFGKKFPRRPTGPLATCWKGGKIKNAYGYVLIYKPHHHRADKRGYVFEHILVAEEKYGRPIKLPERVHHIDLRKDNNEPDNLTLFENLGDHHNYHNRLRQYFD